MGYEPPTYKYTPQQFSKLVDECIAKCKDKDDEYIACPEQLQLHVSLSPQTISGYKNAKEGDSGYHYKNAVIRWYSYMGTEGWKDLQGGNGKYGQNIISRVLKHSEVQEHKHSGAMSFFANLKDKADEVE